MEIKICGLKSKKDIAIVNKYRPEYIGFVFAPTKREVDYDTALHLKSMLTKDIKAVGVFVDSPLETVAKLANSVLDIVQLHGNEDEEYILNLRNVCEKPIIKAVRVKSSQDIIEADKLSCDMLLLDTFIKGELGGSGKCFEHSLIPIIQKPYFVAGGLNASNCTEIVNNTKAFAVDVSTGVEENGVKSEEKVREFIELIRNK